ncbi:uncharacterized protein LOC113553786 isoform X1 [Rhopalosiphum maidis]|uniref:uncharacterized protein LOC113553786 isoform X1 n=1 Tax=Rhopalosiphum maidis TaxID=43146 RepID=UPI000F00A4A6|nr:uncharacterized protein LOC113553786 isoform X1 [Rhopalosiphum maidis]
MEEFTMLRSMLDILNSKHTKKKKAVIEALLILLDTYDVNEEIDVYNLIVTNAKNLCFQVFDPQSESLAWKDSDVSLDDLKSLLVYFINIIKKQNSADIVQLFQYSIELTNKVDFKNCSNERMRNIGFCMQNIFMPGNSNMDNNTQLNNIRNTLLNILNEPYLNKNKLDAVVILLNNIVSTNYIHILWKHIKPIIKIHPNRIMNLLFNMQSLFFDSSCISVILNDDDFWNLTCNLLTCENNVIRTYNNVILKLSYSQLLSENVNYCPNKSKEQYVKVWNDYMVVMETLENTQQHLTLPILSTAKKLALNKTDDNYKLPLKWITAMYCKMSKHSSKYVVLASIDIITSMPIISLKTNEQLLLSFVNSLNNVFLYKMSSDIFVNQPQMEIILSLWFNKLMMSNDGHDVFGIFLLYLPTIKWSIVPLTYLTKSLADISPDCPLRFNIIDHVLKIKAVIEKMPNSYLKTIILTFLFTFTCKFTVDVNTEFNCDLFDCIIVYQNETKSWNYMVNLIQKINDLNYLDKQLSQRINEKNKMYSTSIGLLFLSNIFSNSPISIKELDEICCKMEDISDLLEFLECLLEVEDHFGKYDTSVSQILNKHIWPIITNWVEKCFQILEENSCDDQVICRFLEKVLSSNRIVDSTNSMNIWLHKCYSILIKYSGNYSILAIYSWIGKYATKCSFEDKLKNDWLSFTKYFIDAGFFSIKNQDFYCSRKPGMHQIPQLDIINTFFQHSTVPKEQMLGILEWLMDKTLERHDLYWSIYFSTAKSFLCKFPIQEHSQLIIQFIQNCWDFLVDCRVSCFPNAIKSFIKMAFHNNLLLEEKYKTFIKNQVIQNLLTENYRYKFSVCFSLLLLHFLEEDRSINILELNFLMSEFFTKCLLFSIDRYGAIKIEWDTLEYVRTLNDSFPFINDIPIECLPDDKYLRFKTIKYLYKLNSNILWKNVLDIIIKTESSLRDRKFFHNSKAYRIKQRVVQVLLIVACDKQHESFIFDENIYKWSLSSLKEVSHIHSAAYQLIWLLVLIYNRCKSFYNFWNDFKTAQENHNYMCSLITIVYHLHKIKNNKQFEIEAKKNLLPLCFSNGYKIRFYAQSTIFRLCSNNPEENEWSLLCESMGNIIDQNEQTKKYENPFDDFFYQELDMINSLSLKNICIELPRLLNITHEESFPIKWFNDFLEAMNNDDKYDLSLCAVSSFIEKNTSPVSSNEVIVLDNAQNAQRKYIPSQPLDEHTSKSMLIVVASLIDKVTNLGGLARTCQVFGASTLVVDNLSCVEKKEFTALSMTAEKHQYIVEIRVKNLKSYLQKKKIEGYQIVAAEQTVDSIKLHDIKLPFKCVLLLGNETSGIPHDLLSTMDICVEIEQLGIVRSLNVHVAGSLFIWEYTKQHCLTFSN